MGEKPEEISRDELIQTRADISFKKARENKEMWITLADDNRDYWSSGDSLHFHISKGRCKKLPDELSPIVEHALSKENKLLREANDTELKKEMYLLAEEELIREDKIKPSRYKETAFKL